MITYICEYLIGITLADGEGYCDEISKKVFFMVSGRQRAGEPLGTRWSCRSKISITSEETRRSKEEECVCVASFREPCFVAF